MGVTFGYYHNEVVDKVEGRARYRFYYKEDRGFNNDVIHYFPLSKPLIRPESTKVWRKLRRMANKHNSIIEIGYFISNS